MTAPERGTATLAPEFARRVGTLARSLVAAGRNWALYPPEHPAVSTETDSRGEFRYAVVEAVDSETGDRPARAPLRHDGRSHHAAGACS